MSQLPPVSHVLWVCLGGAVGSGARFLMASWVDRATQQGFPWGTFAVNALGSFALAFLIQLLPPAEHESTGLKLLLTTGLLGGFTTYSSFNYESLRALHDGAWGTALGYVSLTLVTCLGAGALGIWLGRMVGPTG